MAIYSYLWAFSTVSKSTLQSTPSYNIESFTAQADQPSPLWGWREPQRKNTLRPRPARIVVNADQSQSADGFWTFQWCLPPMTPLMFAYILTNQFSSGAVWSAPATVQTWDENVNGYSAFQCTALRPVPGEHYQILDGTFVDVVYRFVNGVLL